MGYAESSICLLVLVGLSVEFSQALRSLLNVPGCGTAGLQARVRGGSEVREGELPWLVSIQTNGVPFCTGTIITHIHVLTAGHCQLTHPLMYAVVYGSVNLDKAKIARVRQHYRPSSYTRQPEGAPFKDILILRLVYPIQFDNQALPICLADGLATSLDGQIAQVAGWGAVDNRSPKPRILRATGEFILPSNTDICKHSSFFGVEYEFCVFDNHNAVCKGDSGGPLMIEEGGYHYQIGLVSYSRLSPHIPHPKCPSKGQPQMFLRFDHLHNFLFNTLRNSGGRRYVKGSPLVQKRMRTRRLLASRRGRRRSFFNTY